MRMFKKTAAVLLAAVMSVGAFTGCGTNNAGNTGNTGDSYTKNNTEYFIGGTGPLTGDASSYGISVKKGADLAIEQINAAGGLNGVKFKFDIKDDKAAAADASTGYDTLFEAGMQISIGSVTSGSCDSFASRAVEDNLFLITPSASAANVIANRKNAFRVCFGDPDQGVLAAEELSKKYTSIGAIYDTSDPYSDGIYKAFDAKMKELGKTYKTQSFDAENKKDFSTQVEALKDCQVIFVPIYYTEAALIAKAVVAKDSKAVLFGCDGLDGIKDQIKDAKVNEISYITPFDVNSKDATVSKFVTDFKAKYNSEPDQFAADGFDAIMVIFETMKAAQINDVTIDPSTLCDKVIKAITDTTFKHVGATGKMTWDQSGACTKVPQIVKLGK